MKRVSEEQPQDTFSLFLRFMSISTKHSFSIELQTLDFSTTVTLRLISSGLVEGSVVT